MAWKKKETDEWCKDINSECRRKHHECQGECQQQRWEIQQANCDPKKFDNDIENVILY